MREIVLDTETTGLDPLRGDRLVEIGCVEIFNRMPTGQTYHVYINPERDMPAEAFAVHGLSAEFLSTKPLFHEVVDAFLEFIGDAPRRQRLVPLAPRVTDAEREAHRTFIATLGDKAIWNEFLPAPAVNPAG